MTVLNGPIEIGMRVLVLLNESYPVAADLNRLVLLDHSLVHSADIDGPASVHPALPLRSGEMGIKRRLIEQGISLMTKAHLVDHEVQESGIYFRASENSDSFLRALESEHIRRLQASAKWVIQEMNDLSDDELRQRMASVLGSWSEEFAIESVMEWRQGV